MEKAAARERIAHLREAINRYRYSYHVLNVSEIPDAALDSLKHELYTLEQQFPDLITADSPTQRVAGKALEKFAKVQHREPMLSIEDVFSKQELEEWLARIKKFDPGKEIDFYAEMKMDGLAVSLEYQGGVLIRASTRGDGQVGEDVTQNIKTIEAIPLKLRLPTEKGISAYPSLVEIRGEVFMSKKVFQELNKEQEKKGEPVFANPRNAAAGSIRQLDPQLAASRRLSFYGYSLSCPEITTKSHEEEHKLIEAFGIPTNPVNRFCKTLEDVQKMYEEVIRDRERYDYWTDGVVVNVNNTALYKSLGIVGKTPRGVAAYKFPAEEATTVVEKVEWFVGRTGAITPVAVVTPTWIGGTTVQHASLHNMDEIERLGLKVGDTVILVKAGDIIPKITKVLTELRPKNAQTIHPPTKCPICESPVERKPGEVALVCTNKQCFAQESARIVHAAVAFDIMGLGGKIAERFIEEGLLKRPADIFTLQEGDIASLERFGEKSAQKLIVEIQAKKSIPLKRFILALGIRHVGEETALNLATAFGDVAHFLRATPEELLRVPDIGEVVAQTIAEWLAEKHNQEEVALMLERGVQVLPSEKVETDERFAGKSFVLTGTLAGMTRDAAKDLIRSKGGKISESVSKKTDYVIVGAEAGSKAEKAKELGVKMLSEEEFTALLG